MTVVMAHLVHKDRAAAAVCRLWRSAWRDRGLRPSFLASPDFVQTKCCQMTMHPDGKRLYMVSYKEVRVIDDQMRTMQLVAAERPRPAKVAASLAQAHARK
jgi:hypothetical protein